MKAIFLLFLIGIIALPMTASACDDCSCPAVWNNITITSILTQSQWMSQQQQQSQEQHQSITAAPGTQSSWYSSDSSGIRSGSYGIEQESQTYSRLLYPGEVIPFPVKPGQNCTLLSGLPVAFYAINSGNGSYDLMVQTLTATPSYDPVYHRMDFGQVPVVKAVNYWTMKALLYEVPSDADYCVVDNRAPFNGYTTIELTVW